MTRCDVAIVGGGPSGSSCAWRLVRQGAQVIVLDRAGFPRDKTCAGWIAPRVFTMLDVPVDEYRRLFTCQPITAFRLGLIGRELTPVAFDAVVGYAIRRREFDAYLLRRSGASVLERTPVRTIERVRDRWVVNGEIEAPMLVGAGGHFCPVARALGAARGREVLVAAQGAEVEVPPAAAPDAVAPGVPELYFCADLLGYGWCVRKGPMLNVGLGREDPSAVPGHLARLVEWLKAHGKVPPSFAPTWRGHAYLLRTRQRSPVVADGAVLVGDAAGLACPTSGEGIRPGVESGLLAARAIAEAGGRYGRRDLEPYADWLASHLPRSRTWLPAGLRAALGGRLLGTGWFARRVIERGFLGIDEHGPFV